MLKFISENIIREEWQWLKMEQKLKKLFSTDYV